MTNLEYQANIQSIASEIVTELKQGGYDPTDIYSAVHEVVDGHEYMIYTHYHEKVIRQTTNEDAYLDVYSSEDLGELIQHKELEGVIQARAFFAMTQDVSDALHELKDGLEDELEALQDEINDTAFLQLDEETQQEKNEQFDLLETIVENL